MNTVQGRPKTTFSNFPSIEAQNGDQKEIVAIVAVGSLAAQKALNMHITVQLAAGKPEDYLINHLSLGKVESYARTYVVSRSIEGLAWLDQNKDGIQDDTEKKLYAVGVTLLKENAAGGYSPVCYPGTDEPITIVTGEKISVRAANRSEAVEYGKLEEGRYCFTDLPAGTYAVQFTSGEYGLDIQYYKASPIKAGTDRTKDSDGVPTYGKGLEKTEITGIVMPASTQLQTAHYESKYNDSGFYRQDITLNPDEIVLDYGKPIQKNVLENDTAHAAEAGYELYIVGVLSYEDGKRGVEPHDERMSLGKHPLFEGGTPEPLSGSYGKFTMNDWSLGNVQYELNQMLDGAERVYVEVALMSKDGFGEFFYMNQLLTILPATSVYYETEALNENSSFAGNVFSYNGSWNTTSDGYQLSAIQDDGTVGNGQTYGYDTGYKYGRSYSNQASMVVNGQGSKKTFVDFSFTGTGFDVISRTGSDEGNIRVEVYSDAGMTKREKAVTVLNKSESNLTLHQVPVVSIENLPHGTHYVRIGVSAAYTNEKFPALSYGAQFTFDAIRIYDPINVKAATTEAQLAQAAYETDGEASQELYEVRNALIDADTFGSQSSMSGMVFIDRNQSSVGIAQYTTIGPNNEVYLQKGQAVAFRINHTSGALPASIDIGAKSADGNPVRLKVTMGTTETTEDIATASALFYDLTKNGNLPQLFANGAAPVVVITNADDGILSVTDLKIAYGEEAGTTSLSADKAVVTRAMAQLNALVPTEPSVGYDGALTPVGVSLDLNSEIAINFTSPASVLDQYDDVYVVYRAEGREDMVVRSRSLNEETARYSFAYDGLTALDLDLAVSATLYGTKDSILYHGDTKTYSVAEYCKSVLANENAAEAQKTVCADLLNYGGAAQLFKGVPAEDCVNAKMTEEEKAYASDPSHLLLEKKSAVSQGTQVRFVGQSLDMDSRIAMNFILNLNGCDTEKLSFQITYTDAEGTAQKYSYTAADLEMGIDGRAALSFAELRSTELRTLVTCTVYLDGVKEASYTNSVENYCCTCVNSARSTEQQKSLAKYLMLYGDAAAAALS